MRPARAPASPTCPRGQTSSCEDPRPLAPSEGPTGAGLGDDDRRAPRGANRDVRPHIARAPGPPAAGQTTLRWLAACSSAALAARPPTTRSCALAAPRLAGSLPRRGAAGWGGQAQGGGVILASLWGSPWTRAGQTPTRAANPCWSCTQNFAARVSQPSPLHVRGRQRRRTPRRGYAASAKLSHDVGDSRAREGAALSLPVQQRKMLPRDFLDGSREQQVGHGTTAHARARLTCASSRLPIPPLYLQFEYINAWLRREFLRNSVQDIQNEELEERARELDVVKKENHRLRDQVRALQTEVAHLKAVQGHSGASLQAAPAAPVEAQMSPQRTSHQPLAPPPPRAHEQSKPDAQVSLLQSALEQASTSQAALPSQQQQQQATTAAAAERVLEAYRARSRRVRDLGACTAEEFMRDLVLFHEVCYGDDAHFASCEWREVLESKRVNHVRPVDYYNLYKEVVSRGGFHRGINWAGQ
eukprot:scaffold8015_cov323-Prasinococcus_capsulatus_cf.AAC.2